MKKVFQINITANWGSHGRIAEDIGKCAMSQGWESHIAYGRRANPSQSQIIRIGDMWDERWHGLQSRILDNHGLASKAATRSLTKKIVGISPDIIHLHNIHGYYLNYPILFNFLATYNRPVIWTLHDCWAFTGHCAYFTYVNCQKWRTRCDHCPNIQNYPTSLLMDKSPRNYELKRRYFNMLDNLTLVPVSEWLNGLLAESFLKDVPRKCIHNGIDLNTFRQNDEMRATFPNKKVVLGVSSIWEPRKGLKDFFQLRDKLDDNYIIVIIGLTKKQLADLPDGIVGIGRTNNVQELTAYYSRANYFVNPTYEDNFPTTNIEALACGTPVITYKTGGAPEAVTPQTGWTVDQGDVDGIAAIVVASETRDTDTIQAQRIACRKHAEREFNKDQKYKEYLDLYNQKLGVI